jgi:uncharacterized protein (DUF2147 family)
MKKHLRVLPIALLVIFAFSFAASKFNANDITGKWYTEENKSLIKIYLAKNGKYYGKIVWLKEPNYEKGDKEEGKIKHDRNNPDKEKRSRPIVGLLLLRGFEFDGDDEWDGGTIYDPEEGKTYKCNMWLSKDKNTLHVRGFIGVSLIGRTTGMEKKIRLKIKNPAITGFFYIKLYCSTITIFSILSPCFI